MLKLCRHTVKLSRALSMPPPNHSHGNNTGLTSCSSTIDSISLYVVFEVSHTDESKSAYRSCAYPLMYDGEIEVNFLHDLPRFGLHRVVRVDDPSISGSGTPIADRFDVGPLEENECMRLTRVCRRVFHRQVEEPNFMIMAPMIIGSFLPMPGATLVLSGHVGNTVDHEKPTQR